MTCIAICKDKLGQILMAGDRRCSSDWSSSYQCPNPKIRKSWNNILTGASGDGGLCKAIVDIFEPPKIEVDDTDIYMYYHYLPNLHRFIKSLPGYQDEHKILKIAVDEHCSALIVVKSKAYILDIYNPEEEIKESALSRITIDDSPIPMAVGCGEPSARPILLEEFKLKGYNTRAGLERAMRAAAEIAPGCDAVIDIIKED